VQKNDPASFHCTYREAVITEWYFKEEGPLKNSTKFSLFPNGTLTLSKVKAFDEGLYKCVGISETGPTQTYTAKMTVAKLDDMNVNNFEPRFHQNPIIWRKGSDFEIRCRPPSGFPKPIVKWEYPAQDSNSGTTPQIDGIFFRIKQVEQHHSGNYTCIASNMAGEKKVVAELMVVPESILVNEPHAKVTTDEESQTLFQCKVTGSPFPITKVKWKKNGKILSSSHRISIAEDTGELKIKPSQLKVSSMIRGTLNG
jgi:hypothetical protein